MHRRVRHSLMGLVALYGVHTPFLWAECAQDVCAQQGGIHYCDSSVDRYVCRNGDYSLFYCGRHAVMDLQKLSGCCLWQGGVLKKTAKGLVICRNGGVSEICSLQRPLMDNGIY